RAVPMTAFRAAGEHRARATVARPRERPERRAHRARRIPAPRARAPRAPGRTTPPVTEPVAHRLREFFRGRRVSVGNGKPTWINGGKSNATDQRTDYGCPGDLTARAAGRRTREAR